MEQNEDINTLVNIEQPNIIKHLVISGGGYYGFYSYGLLEESNKQGFWDIKNIKTMHGTSVGALLCVILCLKYKWEVIEKYTLNRPWDQVFNVDIYSIINIFHQNGLFQIECFKEIFTPLFNGLDNPISIDITLAEFYELNGIDLYIYCTDLNTFKKTILSHKTHPDFSLIEAIYSSCSVPIIFSPLIKGDSCYIDGFFHVHYPIEECLKITENRDEIMGVCTYMFSENHFLKKKVDDEKEEQPISSQTFLDYILHIFVKLLKLATCVEECLENNKIKHQFVINTEFATINEIIEIISNKDRRAKMVEKGRILFHSLQNTVDKLF